MADGTVAQYMSKVEEILIELRGQLPESGRGGHYNNFDGKKISSGAKLDKHYRWGVETRAEFGEVASAESLLSVEPYVSNFAYFIAGTYEVVRIESEDLRIVNNEIEDRKWPNNVPSLMGLELEEAIRTIVSADFS